MMSKLRNDYIEEEPKIGNIQNKYKSSNLYEFGGKQGQVCFIMSDLNDFFIISILPDFIVPCAALVRQIVLDF